MTYYHPLKRHEDIEVSHAQVVYLKYEMNMTCKEIAEIVGYAVSTVKTYCKKFIHLLEWAKQHFKIIKERIIFDKERIQWEVPPTNKPCAYIIEFFDKDGNFLWLKIGKTTNLQRRAKEHLQRAYKDVAYSSVVKGYFEVDDEDDALTMENALRKYYRNKMNNEDYIKRDRFSKQRFEKEVMIDEKILKQYELLTD